MSTVDVPYSLIMKMTSERGYYYSRSNYCAVQFYQLIKIQGGAMVLYNLYNMVFISKNKLYLHTKNLSQI